MKRYYTLANSSSQTAINLPPEKINLNEWIFSKFSDNDYQKCSANHYAMGISKKGDKRVVINVESVGGHLLTQHYQEEYCAKNHVRLVSEESDLWLFHIVHLTIKVIWEMRIIPYNTETSIFRCNVTALSRSKLIKVLSLFGLINFFVQKHDNEETKLFAQDIYNKFK